MSGWTWRLRNLLRRDRLSSERAEEMQVHFDMEVEDGLRQGLSVEESRRRARLRAGLVSEAVESTREEMGFRWLDGAAMDVRHAFRALIHNRGFGLVAMLVLAASVAINTLVFCLLEGVVLKPLPYRAPERLVRLFDAGRSDPKFPMSLGHYLDYKANATSLESIALYTGGDMELTGMDRRSKQLSGVAITPDYFAVLGTAPLLGRAFNDADTHGDVKNAILSYGVWREYFQSDPNVVGKSIRLNRHPWTIVGVAPAGLQHVGGDYRSPLQGETVDVWLPLELDVKEVPLRAHHYCNAIARRREGFTAEQMRQELQRLAAAYADRYPDYGKWGVRMEPLQDEVTGGSRQVVWLLAVAGALVLLVACANIAGLSVARAVARRKELGLRQALGANGWQLLRVGLAENLLIGIAGAVLGIALAAAGIPPLLRMLPADFPRAHEIGFTGLAALFASAVAILTSVLAGLIPAGGTDQLQSSRVTSSRDVRRLRRVLVAGEVAVAGLLCAGSLFLLRSYQEIGARDHGFNPSNALTFRVRVMSPRGDGPPKPGPLGRLVEGMRSKIAEVPGVVSVGASTNLPWSGYDENTSFGIVGRVADSKDSPSARYQVATPGYFEAAGMRLLAGRFFDKSRDGLGQPFTVIVNSALAERHFPDGKAVGAVLDLWGEKRQIIGVVSGIRDYPADLDTKPAFWFPEDQMEFPNLFFAVRTNGIDPASLTPAVTAAVHSVDPDLPLADIRTLETRSAAALAARRFALWLFEAFAALSLILAAAGVYGLLSYIVQQRRKEIGIRVALGARRADLWSMIFSDGLKMAAGGAVCCLLLIPIGGSLLRTFLYNVKAFDLPTISGALAALMVVAFIASVGPAFSAAQSDPATTLRDD